jgi:hypothetical protein
VRIFHWLVVLFVAGVSTGIPDSTAAVPDRPAAAPLFVTIPAGSYFAEFAGDANAGLPKAITLHVGQQLVIRNDDTAMHYLLNQAIAPGRTETFAFDQPGAFSNSGGLSCSLSRTGGTVITVLPKAERRSAPSRAAKDFLDL